MTVGVILAGGAARRLGGGDKALRSLGGRPLLCHVAERVGPQVSHLALSANGPPARFALWNLPVIADTVPGWAGPLAGVLATMDWMALIAPEETDLLTAPVDAPFLPLDLVQRLEQARKRAGADIAVAASGGRPHWVTALWPARLREELRASLTRDGVRKAEAFARRFAVAMAEFDEASCDPFFNINTPADLDEAERIILTQR